MAHRLQRAGRRRRKGPAASHRLQHGQLLLVPAAGARTFIDPAVVALLNDRCVPLHIDAGRPDLIEKMNIQTFPTLVYASPEGRVLGYQEGSSRRRSSAIRCSARQRRRRPGLDDARLRGGEEGGRPRTTPVRRRFSRASWRTARSGWSRRRRGSLMQEVEQQAAERLKAAQTRPPGPDRRGDEGGRRGGEQFAGADAAREAADFAATLTSRTDAGDQQRKDRPATCWPRPVRTSARSSTCAAWTAARC